VTIQIKARQKRERKAAKKARDIWRTEAGVFCSLAWIRRGQYTPKFYNIGREKLLNILWPGRREYINKIR